MKSLFIKSNKNNKLAVIYADFDYVQWILRIKNTQS